MQWSDHGAPDKQAIADRPELFDHGRTRDETRGQAELHEARETNRLTLTRPRLADVPELFEFLGSPMAMSHTRCDRSLVECRRRIAVHEWKRRVHGYAPWVVREKGETKPIGWGGLYDDPFEPGWGMELAYYFHPAFWGRGYATELCLTALEVADHELAAPTVSAFAHPNNKASNKLLQKVGFRWQRYVPEMDRNLYSRPRQPIQSMGSGDFQDQDAVTNL